MATVTRTIIAGGGGDYTTIAAWETATNLNGDTDIWKGVISDNSAYDEAVVIDGGGTNNTTSYVWLTVASGNRHDGTWDTGKARINYSGADTAAIELQSDYVFLEWLQIYRPTSGSISTSDEGIRVTSTGDTGCLISRCLIWTDDNRTATDTDGIYTGNWAITSLHLDHVIIYGWARGGLHGQMFSTTADQTFTVNHCMFVWNGDTSADEADLNLRNEGGTTTCTAYNSVFLEGTGGENSDVSLDDGGTGDVVTVAGSHNCFNTIDQLGTGTTNLNWTNTTAASAGIEATDTANAVIVTNATFNPVAAATDLTPQDLANNVLLTNGTDRQGSEPDPRQDFSTDITGASRGTTNVDIGPWQITGGTPATTASAGNAASTATSYNPTTAVKTNATEATATATANNPTAALAAIAANAAATATAYNPTVVTVDSVTAPAQTATATATANNPTAAVDPNAGNAAATATAYDATVSTVPSETAPAETATATATATNPTTALTVNAGNATSTATAYNPTVQTSEGTTALAGNAASTATATDPTAAVDPNAGNATATATATDPTIAIELQAGNATATATAYNPTVQTSGSTTAPAGNAAATATASNPTTALQTAAATATATGTAYNATVSTVAATTAPAGNATATATAYNPTIIIGVNPTTATTTATANQPTPQLTAAPGAATATANAINPIAAIAVLATAATVTAAAYNATGPTPLVFALVQHAARLNPPDHRARIESTHQAEIRAQ